MKVYSLISCSSDYFCMGIYTTLDNVYTVLKDCVKLDLECGFNKEEIKNNFYEIKIVSLDAEPLECHEFSTYGKNIKIEWEKIFNEK